MPTPSPESPVLLTRQGGIVTLQFNRPHALNAIDVPLATALRDAVRTLAGDASVRCIVLRGAGKGFMAGGDIATLSADPVQGAQALLTPLNEAVALLAQINAPVIAQVHGVAAGAGLSLMLQADFVIAAEGTRLNIAYINLGASCDVGGAWSLARILGLRKALEFALLGDTHDAADALRMGLINRVVPADELEAAVAALAERLARGPTVAYGHLRRLLRAASETPLPEQLVAEAQSFFDCARTQDFREGLSAFQARRPAQFEGR